MQLQIKQIVSSFTERDQQQQAGAAAATTTAAAAAAAAGAAAGWLADWVAGWLLAADFDGHRLVSAGAARRQQLIADRGQTRLALHQPPTGATLTMISVR